MNSLIASPDLFGHIAAEEEHEDIQVYFQETHVFESIYHGQKYLVLGRKGSGKSALFFYLQKRFEMDGIRVTPMTLNNYPQDKFADLKVTSVDETEAHVQTWKFALLLTFMGLYLDVAKDTNIQDPSVSNYKRFYNENSLSHIVSPLWNRVCDFVKSVEQINFTALGVGGGFSRNLERVTRTNFGLYANQINAHLLKMLQRSVSQYMPSSRLVILIDRLDEQWRNTEQSNSLLIGLLKACREINRELEGCRVIIFLRSDIFHKLRYQNRGQITEFIQDITWKPRDLQMVIARRIAAKLGDADMSEEGFIHTMWSEVFGDINVSLYHASRGKGQRIMKFFESNSFNRPRDYIQLAKCLQEVAKAYGLNTIAPRHGVHMLDRIAEEAYSKRVVTEFQDELMDVMLNFDHVMAVISRELGRYRFTLDEFCTCLNKGGVTGDPMDILKTLFDYSIVGKDYIGGTRRDRGPGGRGEEYMYQGDLVRFDGNEMFKFHPSIRSYLHLTAGSTAAVAKNEKLEVRRRSGRTPNDRAGILNGSLAWPSLWDEPTS